jgi:hypothetical protein
MRVLRTSATTGKGWVLLELLLVLLVLCGNLSLLLGPLPVRPGAEVEERSEAPRGEEATPAKGMVAPASRGARLREPPGATLHLDRRPRTSTLFRLGMPGRPAALRTPLRC